MHCGIFVALCTNSTGFTSPNGKSEPSMMWLESTLVASVSSTSELNSTVS